MIRLTVDNDVSHSHSVQFSFILKTNSQTAVSCTEILYVIMTSLK